MPYLVSPRVAKCINLANQWDYFDQLWEVYPLEVRGEVPLTLALLDTFRNRLLSGGIPQDMQADTSEVVGIVTSATATSVLRVSSPRYERRLVIEPSAPK